MDLTWFLELNNRHKRQDFDNVAILSSETETQNRVNLSLCYRNLDPGRIR